MPRTTRTDAGYLYRAVVTVHFPREGFEHLAAYPEAYRATADGYATDAAYGPYAKPGTATATGAREARTRWDDAKRGITRELRVERTAVVWEPLP